MEVQEQKILASRGAVPAQVKEAQRIVERQVGHMALLLDDLLDIARITQGKLRLKKETLSLFPVLDAAVEAVRPTLESKKQTLALDLPSTDVFLDADRMRLSQVVSNLLMNAVKYSEPGGHIQLACTSQGAGLELAIRDNGAGIAPEAMTGIFEMFTQVGGGSNSEGGLESYSHG